MATGWFQRGGDERVESSPTESARAEMVRAFLDLDKRLTIITEGITSARALDVHTDVVAEFEPLQTSVFGTIERYLALNSNAAVPAESLTAVTREIHRAAVDLDAFYQRHVAALEHSRQLSAAIPTISATARKHSDDALAAAHDLPESIRAQSGVHNAVTRHRQIREAFDSAHHDGAIATTQAAAKTLNDDAAALMTVVADAPGRTSAVASALASVRTRRDGVHTRNSRLPEAYSALLREFSAACSNDLAGVDRQAEHTMGRASDEIDQARRLLPRDPDEADSHLAAARALLRDAELLVDSVTDRLATLRAVRDRPADLDNRVQFAIRDAQLLAVTRNLVAQWGSVLDAANDRRVRAWEILDAAHPDYWGYVQEMTAIEEFVGETVDKMKRR